MKKLIIAIALSTFSYAASHLEIDKQNRLEDVSGLTYNQDNFGNIWPQITDLDGDPLTQSLVSFLSTITQKGNAILIDLPLKDFGKSEAIKSAGFTLHHASDSKMQWKVQNGSPMPDPMTSIGGARLVVLNDTGEVLVIEDKNLPGRLMFPGGSNDLKELLWNTAVRELKEEVGYVIRTHECKLIAQTNRVMANRFGANDICNYYLIRNFSGKLEPDAAEVSWAGWIPIKTILDNNGFALSESKFLKASYATLKILRHVLGGAKESTVEIMPDMLRQLCKSESEMDVKDRMHFHLFSEPTVSWWMYSVSNSLTKICYP